MDKLLLTIILFFICQDLFGTAQIPDEILYNGKTYSLHSNPLESYFEKNPDKRPKGGVVSTALWRGYVATFEIRDSSLYLKDIKIEEWEDGDNNKSYWKSVLKETFTENELKLDWYTGLMIIPYGKMINYVHMGYGSSYKRYILLEIHNGILANEYKFNNKEFIEFKIKQFEAFKKTTKYTEMVNGILKEDENYGIEFIDSFLFDFAIEYMTLIYSDSID